jgi:surfeit locus 1 family protein
MTRRDLIPALAALAVIILTVSLGNWQLRRADEKTQAQQARDAALARPAQSIGPEPLRAGALDGERVRAQGTFLDEQSIFLDNRTHKGVAGFHVISPLRLMPADPGDARAQHVLVLRGWVAADRIDRKRLPTLATPSGPVSIEGVGVTELPQAMLLGGEPGPGPDGARLWQRFTMQAYTRWSGLSIQPLLIRQLSELDDGLTREWVVPGEGADRHRAYAFQWYAMAIATGVLWLGVRLLARRRRASTP